MRAPHQAAAGHPDAAGLWPLPTRRWVTRGRAAASGRAGSRRRRVSTSVVLAGRATRVP